MNRPPHIPDELVVDFDYFNLPGGGQDPHLAYYAFQKDGPDIFWTPRNGGHWVITRAEDIKVVESDYARFTHEMSGIPQIVAPGRTLPIQCDPPEHWIYREPLVRPLMPRSVEAMAPKVRQIVVELIDTFVERGECEFVAEFADIFPIVIFLDLVDLPREDRAQLLPLAAKIIRGSMEVRGPAFQGLFDYLAPWVEKRRATPGDDLMSQMVNIQVDGGKIPFDDAVGYVRTVCLGGLDTVAAMLGFIIRFFAMNPEHRRTFQARMDDGEFVRRALEELMRRHGIVSTTRAATHDFEFKDVQFRKGDAILVPNLYVGLDDRCVTDPLTVDFDRSPAVAHAIFDVGPHACVGAHLARRELRIFLEEWFKRIPDFSIKPGTKPLTGTGMVSSVLSLEIVWPARSVA